jgi:hypothetical protein
MWTHQHRRSFDTLTTLEGGRRLFLRVSLLVLLGSILTPVSAQVPPSSRPAQAPAESVPTLPKAEGRASGEDKPYVDLTNRYRFIQRYAVREDQEVDDAIGLYQVAIKDVSRHWVNADDPAEKPTEEARLTIFAERAAEASGLTGVSATIRRYEKFEARPAGPVNAGGPPIDGLTIWYRPQLNEGPLILSLSEGRHLTERDYEIAARQVFMPTLAAVLPAVPVRVGDSWRIPRKALQAMLGEPELRADSVTGKFLELHRDADGKSTYAVVGIAGKVYGTFTETSLNAQVRFAFPTPGAEKADDPKTKGATAPARPVDESLVEAHGAITELRMASVSTGPVTGGSKGQRFRTMHEVVLETKPGQAGGADAIKLVPAPEVTEANSWLTHHDPKGRFTFEHPQSLRPPERYQFATRPDESPVLLVKSRMDGRDLVRIEAFAKEQTPEALKERLTKQWAQMQVEVIPGNEEWLPESDWPSMKVFRIEAALKLPSRTPRGSRLHYDAFLVKPSKDVCVTVVATTSRDAVAPFRRDIERMIKTFRLTSKAGN